MTQRLRARHDFRVPAPLPPGKTPRVEFVSGNRTVSVLQTPAPAPTRAPGLRPPVGSEVPPVPAPKANLELTDNTGTHNRDLTFPVLRADGPAKVSSFAPADAAAPAGVSRPRRATAASPSVSTPAFEEPRPGPAPRHEPDNSVTVKRIDIQIFNEEARKPARRNSRPAAGEHDANLRLDRYYVRDIL